MIRGRDLDPKALVFTEASESLTEAISGLIKGQMEQVLMDAGANLHDDQECTRILVEHGFGSASVAALSHHLRSSAREPSQRPVVPALAICPNSIPRWLWGLPE